MRVHQGFSSAAAIILNDSTSEPSQMVSKSSPWLTPVEAALYLRIALGTLRNWTSARYIPFSKRGRIVRYHRDALDKWLSRGACPGRATLANAR